VKCHAGLAPAEACLSEKGRLNGIAGASVQLNDRFLLSSPYEERFRELVCVDAAIESAGVTAHGSGLRVE